MDQDEQEQAQNEQPKHSGVELIGGKTDIHMSEKEHNKMLVNQQTVAKVQAQLEAKVQKLLDELTILVNNQYSKGKHTYDYQLVRLTEGQLKAEREALDKADEIYFKHSNLKKQEDEMNAKFSKTQTTLNEYKANFAKQMKSLQQDHDTYVKIKSKQEKELSEQLEIQKENELQINEALQEKADLRLKESTSKKLTKKQEKDFVQDDATFEDRAQQLVTAEQSVKSKLNESAKVAADEQQKRENAQKKKLQEEKQAYEKKKLEAKKKAEEE